VALKDNVRDGALREMIVTMPRALTQAQASKWKVLTSGWAREAERLGYAHAIAFTLWDESRLLDLLLKAENRGLLLHFFEYPDFDIGRCAARTRNTIAGLGDRYRPGLHTTTEAEGKLHAFLRSERIRQEYLQKAREKLHDRWWLPQPGTDWPDQLRVAYDDAEAKWQEVQLPLGDGLSLPRSFSALAERCAAAAAALDPVEKGIASLIPPRQSRLGDDNDYPYPKHPNEEALDRVDRWGRALRSFGSYLRAHVLADLPCLLFTGPPGTGKTHVLAEVCSRYAAQGGIVLFVEGAKFTNNDPIARQFMQWAAFPGTSLRDLLETLNAMAEGTGLPVLLCVDAVNETPDRNIWRSGIEDFAAEVRSVAGVKLVVSCRSDYLKQTMPKELGEQRMSGWAFAEHEGLGVEVFEAFPKYVAAYRVRWNGLPPLAREFQNLLFLKIFCEAYAGRTPEPGTLTLATVLREFAGSKAKLLGRRIDCDPNRTLAALRELSDAMLTTQSLMLPEQTAWEICLRHHTPTESSRSLYRALLSEGVLAEFLGPDDELGATSFVRFTYERIWDYFVSLRVLPQNAQPSSELVTKLRNADWRWRNSGVVGLLITRYAEAAGQELIDLIAPNRRPATDLIELFLEGLPWRTKISVSSRTWKMFQHALKQGLVENEFDHLVPLAPNPEHPWNAAWLHDRLLGVSLAERDRTWTWWVNEQFLDALDHSPLRELLSWAERAPVEILDDEHLLLLATLLAWCASTTVPAARQRLATTLVRLLANRMQVTIRLVERFSTVDDPYVLERVLFAAAGAAQHANEGDTKLTQLARVVHGKVFADATVQPHILIRHYATEICEQARTKAPLPPGVTTDSCHPPFRSRWPRIWTDAQYRRKREALNDRPKLFASVEPGPDPGYGNWGRYVMSGRVHNFNRNGCGSRRPMIAIRGLMRRLPSDILFSGYSSSGGILMLRI